VKFSARQSLSARNLWSVDWTSLPYRSHVEPQVALSRGSTRAALSICQCTLVRNAIASMRGQSGVRFLCLIFIYLFIYFCFFGVSSSFVWLWCGVGSLTTPTGTVVPHKLVHRSSPHTGQPGGARVPADRACTRSSPPWPPGGAWPSRTPHALPRPRIGSAVICRWDAKLGCFGLVASHS